MSEEPAERRRRLYSGGYHNGARLAKDVDAAYVDAFNKRRGNADPYSIALGVIDYYDGFEDGSTGRPPAMDLLPADVLPAPPVIP